MVGRWSVKWQDIQEKFNKSMKNKRSHRRWATAIIRKLLTISWAIWDFRNDQVHGPDSRRMHKLNKELNCAIRAEYLISYTDLLPINHHWFTDQSPLQLINSDATKKQDWLKIVRLARKDKESNKLTDPNRAYTQLLVTDFFRPQRN